MAVPVFIFVPGALHVPEHYQVTIDALARRGYDRAVGVYTAGLGDSAATAAPGDNVQSIRQIAREYTSKGQKVIYVAHSAGGVEACQAVNEDGVIGIVFMCALLALEGESLIEMQTRVQIPMAASFDFSSHGLMKPSAQAGELFFSDLLPAEQADWASKLQPKSTVFATTPVQEGAWDFTKPKLYVLTAEDKTLPYWSQKAMLKRVDDGKWRTAELQCDHAPFLSRPEEMADILVEFAASLFAA